MERRNFFGWVGKVSLAIGLGYLAGQSEITGDEITRQFQPQGSGDFNARMNARACYDFRMISNDRSMRLDRDIFYS